MNSHAAQGVSSEVISTTGVSAAAKQYPALLLPPDAPASMQDKALLLQSLFFQELHLPHLPNINVPLQILNINLPPHIPQPPIIKSPK